MWDDLLNFYNFCDSPDYDNSAYFLGNMVYHKDKEKNEETYYVVDGQQRLTSLTILLKILQEKSVTYPRLYKLIWKTEEDLGGGVKKKEPLELNVISNVLGDKETEYFKEVINSNPQKDKNTLNSAHKTNYFLLKEKVDEWYNKHQNDIEYKTFVDTIITKVVLLPILCEDQEHALTIFETINNRGKSLSDSDIFKSHLYKIALKKGDTDLFIDRWNNIYNKSEENILELFRIYSHIIRGKKGDYDIEIGLRKFFTIEPYKSRAGLVLSKQPSWESIIEDLEKLAFCKEYLSKHSDDNIRKWWDTLTLVSNTYVPYILYTYLFYNISLDDNQIPHLSKHNENEFEALCKASVKYFYGKRLCNKTQIDMKQLMFELVSKLTNNVTPVGDVISSIKEKLQDNQNLIEERINNDEFGKIKTPLIHILAYMHDKQKYISNVNVEHILPKKWEHYEFKPWGWNADTVKENIEKLGNLVLIEAKLNRYANNHILSQKQEKAYQHSEIKVCLELTKLTTWNLDDLDNRDRNCKGLLKTFFRTF